MRTLCVYRVPDTHCPVIQLQSWRRAVITSASPYFIPRAGYPFRVVLCALLLTYPLLLEIVNEIGHYPPSFSFRHFQTSIVFLVNVIHNDTTHSTSMPFLI
jgi:hypothetical protein